MSRRPTVRCAFALLLVTILAACAHGRDRTEITNLVYSYAHHYDGGRFDDFLALFAEDMIFQFGTMPKSGKESLAALRERNQGFVEQGIQRRHVMTNLVINEQSAKRAQGEVYFTLFSNDGSGVEIIGNGRYAFVAKRTGHEWLLSEWRILPDGPLPGAEDRRLFPESE